MEFFREISAPEQELATLQNLLTIKSLPALTPSISSLLSDQGNHGEIYSVWGQFNVNRELIRCGVRFTLVNCPHAFAWTTTINDKNNTVIVHCTMDKSEHDEEFIESIDQFMDEWADSLNRTLQTA
jgi:hypothetical protein